MLVVILEKEKYLLGGELGVVDLMIKRYCGGRFMVGYGYVVRE